MTGSIGHRLSGAESQPVGGADHKGIEGVLGIKNKIRGLAIGLGSLGQWVHGGQRPAPVDPDCVCWRILGCSICQGGNFWRCRFPLGWLSALDLKLDV